MMSTEEPISLLCTRSLISCLPRRLGPSENPDGEPGMEKEATRPVGAGWDPVTGAAGSLQARPSPERPWFCTLGPSPLAAGLAGSRSSRGWPPRSFMFTATVDLVSC